MSEWLKGQPVTELKEDHTYVVEFWATWCGPCRTSIPHLSKLQKAYGDKITFIGVSVWERDWSKVAPFVEEMGDEMNYRVARDLVPEGSEHGLMAQNWLRAAKQDGIPAAFVVSGGKIAWIGHPMEIDGPLKRIAAGEWNMEEAAAKARLAMARKAKIEQYEKEIMTAMRASEYDKALAALDKLVAVDPKRASNVAGLRFELLLKGKHFEKAYAFARKTVEGEAAENPGFLNAIAWTIVDPEGDVEKKDLDLALQAATRACELTEWKSPHILDTLARVHFEKGNVEKAIELQKKAVEHAQEYPEMAADLTKTLVQYEKAVQVEGL